MKHCPECGKNPGKWVNRGLQQHEVISKAREPTERGVRR